MNIYRSLNVWVTADSCQLLIHKQQRGVNHLWCGERTSRPCISCPRIFSFALLSISLTLVAVIYINKRRHKWSLKKAEQWFLTTDIKFSRFTALFFKHGYSVDYLENPYIENQPSKLFRLLNSYFACHHIFKEPKKGTLLMWTVNIWLKFWTLLFKMLQ